VRLAFLCHPSIVRDPVDPATVWSSPRGLTGSEIAYFKFAEHLGAMGHDVFMFTKFTEAGSIGTVKCLPYDQWESSYCRQGWDAACGWTTAEPLFHVRPGTFRFLNHQCNGFSTSPTGWEQHVDVLAPLSNTHARLTVHETSFPRDRWRVLHNGVDTQKFSPGPKVSGKIIWASSLDRGLHWLLEMFPAVRREVPHAELHIFYNFHSVNHMAVEYVPGKSFITPMHLELGARSRYILEAIRRMEGLGVHAHQSVSRESMEDEMRTSSVLAYPLDPVYFTETFGVVVLEACASGTAPLLCTADAFGELWGSAAECVPPPFKDHRPEFFRKLVRLLTDEPHRGEVARRCVSHAKRFEWSSLAANLEMFLRTRGSEGLPRVDWTGI